MNYQHFIPSSWIYNPVKVIYVNVLCCLRVTSPSQSNLHVISRQRQQPDTLSFVAGLEP